MRTIQNSILLLLLFSFTGFAQENDFQTWHSISSSFDFTIIQVPDQLNTKSKRKGSITFKQGYRFRENSSLLSKQFSDFRSATSNVASNTRGESKDIGDVRASTPERAMYSDAVLTILTNKNNPVVECRFRDVFPTSLSGLTYSQNQTDVEYLTASVDFKYTIYEIITL